MDLVSLGPLVRVVASTLSLLRAGEGLADVGEHVALEEEGVVLGLEVEAPALHGHTLHRRPLGQLDRERGRERERERERERAKVRDTRMRDG